MKKFSAVLSVLMLVASLSACGGGKVKKLEGAGASFPYPLYTKMFDTYYQKHGVQVNYQSIGSGGGIKSISSKVVDFGASDKPLSDANLAKIDGKLLHIPMALGAITLAYNIPGNPSLKIDIATLADILLGKIKKWNNTRIQALNPGVKLPDLAITFVHRSDGSGTTFGFTDYLDKASPAWHAKVGKGKTVNWPLGLGGKGNEGVTANIRQNSGAFGYIEFAYARQNNIKVMALKNKSGNFIAPSIDAVSKAAAVSLPDDTRVSIANTSAPQGYPIASFTWVLLYQEQSYEGRTKAQAKALVDLLWWMSHDGQKINATLDYAPIPAGAVEKAEKILNSVTYKGVSVR